MLTMEGSTRTIVVGGHGAREAIIALKAAPAPLPTLQSITPRTHPALDEIAVAELGFRISDCTLRHPARNAHLGETDADGLGVEHLCANRDGEILGIDHVGNDRAAERQQDLGS